jgi:hypothetical protein
MKFECVILPVEQLAHYIEADLACQISTGRASVLYRNLFPLGSTLDQMSDNAHHRRGAEITLPSFLMDEFDSE